MALPTVVSGNPRGHTATTAGSVVLPSVSLNDALIFMCLGVGANVPGVTGFQAGWTQIQGDGFGGGIRRATYMRPAIAANLGSPTLSWTFTTSFTGVCIVVGVSNQWGANVPPGTAWAQSDATGGGSTASQTSGTTIAAPNVAIAGCTSEELLVSIFLMGSTATTMALPGGQTSVINTTNGGYSAMVGWEQLPAVPAATGTRTATNLTSIDAMAGNFTFHGAAGSIAMNTPPANPMIASLRQPGVALIGGGIITSPSMARAQPTWLADVGVGPASSAAGSANITQSGVQPSSAVMNAANVSGSISGVVTISSVPVSGCLVCLYHRPNGHMIKSTRTVANGTYTFTGLDPTAISDNSYYAVAIDPNNLGTQYNSLIYDRLIPG